MLVYVAVAQMTFYAMCGFSQSMLNYDTRIDFSENFTYYIRNMINFYSDYDINFHFNAKDVYFIDYLMKRLDPQTISPMILRNYDRNRKEFKRSNTKEILHVVLLDVPKDFISYSRLSQNARSRDVVYFVLQNSNVTKDLLNINGLDLYGNVLITLSKDLTVHNYCVCYFCGDRSLQIEQFDVYSNMNTKYLEARTFSNFYGHSLKVIFIDYFPLAWCLKQYENSLMDGGNYKICKEVKGTEYELINVLAEKLNFKIIPFLSEDEYVDIINQTGTGLFDIAMGGITVTSDRCKLATFTTKYWYEGYNCLFFSNNEDIWRGLFSFSLPLQRVLWFAFIATCLVVVLTFHLMGQYGMCKNVHSEMSGVNILWICFYILVDQQAPLSSTLKLQRRSFLVLGAWCLVCLNMSTAYKSKLLSTLLNPSSSEPQNLVQLAEKGYDLVTNRNYADVMISFLADSRKYERVPRRTIFIDDVCGEFEYAATHRAAVVDEYTSLQYEVRNTCLRKLKKYHVEHVRITRPIKMYGHGWALKKNVPFEDVFNRIISRVVSAGLILKWRKDITRGMDNSKSFFRYSQIHVKEHKGYERVGLHTLVSPFFVYIMGNVFAMMAFICEITMYKYVKIKSCM